MHQMNRRAVLTGATALGAAFALGGCVADAPPTQPLMPLAPIGPVFGSPFVDLTNPNYTAMYAPVMGDRFPIPAIDLTKIDPAFLRSEVAFPTPEVPGTIVIDPAGHYLYLVQPGGRAIRYGVGVGTAGLRLVGHRHDQQQAGMAGLVSAQGDA